MNPVQVVVLGAAGRMGREIIASASREPDMKVVGAVDATATTDRLPLPDGSAEVPFSPRLDAILEKTRPDVLVDFSTARATMSAVREAAGRGIHLVIGTTGLSQAEVEEIRQLATAHSIGAVVAPNFALGAVLMMHFAKLAAKYLDYAEIIELHHNQKLDAPSGTALSTARAMAATRGRPFATPAGEGSNQASRGQQVEGIQIHSVRLPGLLAHQEVVFGALGQTLSIRHDTISRECFMPGVMLAIREVVGRRGLIYGLDALLGL